MYLPEVFVQTERRTAPSEGARSVRKMWRQIRSRTDRENEVNKTFIIWLLVHFPLCSKRCVRLQMLPVTLYLWAYCFCFHIDKQISRNATLMFQNMLLFELFQRTYLNSIFFPPQLTGPGKKELPSHSAGKAIRFFPDFSAATNQRAPWPENKFSRIINVIFAKLEVRIRKMLPEVLTEGNIFPVRVEYVW